MLTPNEIQAIHYKEFIRSDIYPDYTKKYHLAIRILKRKPKVVEQIKERKNKLKKKYGYDLFELQVIFYANNDLKAFFHPKNDEQMNITRLELKNELENFMNDLEEIVDDNIGGGLGL